MQRLQRPRDALRGFVADFWPQFSHVQLAAVGAQSATVIRGEEQSVTRTGTSMTSAAFFILLCKLQISEEDAEEDCTSVLDSGILLTRRRRGRRAISDRAAVHLPKPNSEALLLQLSPLQQDGMSSADSSTGIQASMQTSTQSHAGRARDPAVPLHRPTRKRRHRVSPALAFRQSGVLN